MRLATRLEHADEHLDRPQPDPRALERGLDNVDAANRWLGGRRSLLRHLPALLPRDRPAELLDVGTGSAALPRAIARWARRHGRAVRILAVDRNPQALEIARRRSAGYPEIALEAADARALPHADGRFDVALLWLTLHHFEGDDPVRVLRELDRVTRRGILVGELERCWPNYLGARALAATLWRRRITRHDGPVSVLRAFRAPELLALARAAGLARPRVHRHFFHRLVLESRKDAP